MQLSKSDFLKYRACPSYFWLVKHTPELVPPDTAEEVLENKFEQGNQVETLARRLFPSGLLIEGYNRAAELATQQAVAAGATTLFQATVLTDDGLLAMADVLERDGDGWILYEVKSSGTIKKELHIPDMAFQKIAFERAGYTITDTRIIHLNKEYVRSADAIDPYALFVTESVDAAVHHILPEVTDQIAIASDTMRDDERPTACPCRLLSRGKHCPTFRLFNPDVPEYSVYDVARLQGKKLAELIDHEIVQTVAIPDDFPLSANQALQVAVDKSGQPRIDTASIARELAALTYPLYFIDYESVNPAIPLLVGAIPHQQIVFQYSLHILDRPDAELRHTEYLCRDTSLDSFRGLVEQMRRDIGEYGSVIVWNKSFEASRNRELGCLFPDYAQFFEDINERIYDLMDIFSKNYYIHPDFHGSNSIKSVLPVLAPHLSYKDLAIGKGDLASARWYDTVTGHEASDDERVFEDLLAYCGLDTFAMVEIFNVLRHALLVDAAITAN